jgi:hypothetical protein
MLRKALLVREYLAGVVLDYARHCWLEFVSSVRGTAGSFSPYFTGNP